MKKWSLAVGVVALAVLATSVLAVGPGSRAGGCQDCPGPGYGAGPGAGYGPGAGKGFGRMAEELNLSKDQLDKLAEMRKRHWDDVQPLRDEMFKKRQELRDLFTNPASKDEAILAKQKELNALQQTMRDKMVQFRLEQRKVFTPDQLEKMKDLPGGYGKGCRQGYGRGYGQGKGPGRGPGSGPDCCS
jgi:Spy/CpxP family protein refolding chaperone